MFYMHYAYKDECKDYSKYLMVLFIENIIWVLISAFGSSAIISKSSSKIKCSMIFLLFFMFIRIGTFYVMQQKIDDVIDDKAKSDWYCDAVYVAGIYII